MTFRPVDYGPTVAAILGDGQRLMSLGPGSPNLTIQPALMAFDPLHDLGPVKNRNAAQACLAALWIYHDFHDQAHAIAQELPTVEGSAWHAIIHRREPDAWNAKYWWNRVGSQKWMTQVGYGSASRFVDDCEKVLGTGSDGERNAQQIQLCEWQALFHHCFQLVTTDS